MIVLTGASGFIGSVVLRHLNRMGYTDVALVDDLPTPGQYKNLQGTQFSRLYTMDQAAKISDQLHPQKGSIEAVVHLGACADTTVHDWNYLCEMNVNFTRKWITFCNREKIPLIFASSAAVYGNGCAGPLNEYAFSKYVSEQEMPEASVVLRLFNVYGPGEGYKGRMASVIRHWIKQAESGTVNVFAGSEKFYRDFIYVEDAARVITHFVNHFTPGTYDVGTGHAVQLSSLAEQIVEQTVPPELLTVVKTIEMPHDLKHQYQTYTCADVKQLQSVKIDTTAFRDVEDGIRLYDFWLKQNLHY